MVNKKSKKEKKKEKDAIENALMDIKDDINLEEQESEASFIKKINELKEEILSDSESSRSEVFLPKEQQVLATKAVSIEFTDIISLLNKKKYETPYADEFWKYYFHDKNLKNPRTYLGGTSVREKIIGLIEEVSNIILNPDLFNIQKPINEKIKDGKVFYVGDSHGSILDTDKCIRFFVKQIQEAERNNEGILIIFLGDYVDRNKMDIHNLLYILTFALKYPKIVRLLRGNHEEVVVNMQYGFWDSINRYLPNTYLFNDFEYLFMKLPLVHVIHFQSNKSNELKSIISLHGGIPVFTKDFSEMPKIPNIVHGVDVYDSYHSNIDEFDDLSRQILWNDPAIDLPLNTYYLPSRRGIGINFGKEVFDRWMEVNKVERLIRAHEVFLEGYKQFFNDRLFSVFSSSNYIFRKIEAKILEFDFSKPWDKNWRYLTILKDL